MGDLCPEAPMVADAPVLARLTDLTTDEIEEKSKLVKSLRRFDLVFFLICTLVGLDTIGAVAKNGAQGFTWLVFPLVFIWFAVVSAIVSFRFGKWIPSVGAFVRVAILAFFTVSVLLYAAKHGVHGFGGGAFAPGYAIFIAAVPVLIFNYVGFE